MCIIHFIKTITDQLYVLLFNTRCACVLSLYLSLSRYFSLFLSPHEPLSFSTATWPPLKRRRRRKASDRQKSMNDVCVRASLFLSPSLSVCVCVIFMHFYFICFHNRWATISCKKCFSLAFNLNKLLQNLIKPCTLRAIERGNERERESKKEKAAYCCWLNLG